MLNFYSNEPDRLHLKINLTNLFQTLSMEDVPLYTNNKLLWPDTPYLVKQSLIFQ